MKILFPKNKYYLNKWYIINAKEKTLGYLSTLVIKYLCGKETSFYTPFVDQGNFVIIININHLKILNLKKKQKLYYKFTNRPGNLKKETYKDLEFKFPEKIFKKAIYGMLPKNKLSHNYLKRLFILNESKLNFPK
jgi:large subunit ribosomal protein L13